jgi:transposase
MQAGELIKGLHAEHLLANKGYDIDELVNLVEKQGMKAQIPPRENRKVKRSDDKHLYKQRYLVENAFYHLKRWRGIATRYAKRASSFLVAVQIRCISLWLKVNSSQDFG